MTLPGLTFEPTAHRYEYRGRHVPNVTGILTDLKVSPPYPADRGWLEFGKAVHKCCELAMQDKLVVEQWHDGSFTYPGTSEVLWPYITAFRQKVAEYKIIPKETELLVYNDMQGYAGMLDLFCTIFDGDEAIIDFKTGRPPECVRLQTAAYDMALNRTLGLPERKKMRRRFAMYLFEDEVKQTGNARMIEFTDPFDYEAFSGMVAHWKWKNKKGWNH